MVTNWFRTKTHNPQWKDMLKINPKPRITCGKSYKSEGIFKQKTHSKHHYNSMRKDISRKKNKNLFKRHKRILRKRHKSDEN